MQQIFEAEKYLKKIFFFDFAKIISEEIFHMISK